MAVPSKSWKHARKKNAHAVNSQVAAEEAVVAKDIAAEVVVAATEEKAAVVAAAAASGIGIVESAEIAVAKVTVAAITIDPCKPGYFLEKTKTRSGN